MDKKLKYIKISYTIIFTLIVFYIVKNNFILNNQIFNYKILISSFQKIEITFLGMLIFFISMMSHLIVDGKIDKTKLKSNWIFESLRKFVWIKGVDSKFLDDENFENKKYLINFANFLALSLISIFVIFAVKPQWTLFLLYLIFIFAGVCFLYYKKQNPYLNFISFDNFTNKEKISIFAYEIFVNICYISLFIYFIKKFTDINYQQLILIYCVSQVIGLISLAPSGLIVSDLLAIHLLSHLIEPQASIMFILLYRIISVIIPWLISLAMILRKIYNDSYVDGNNKQFAFKILSIITLVVGIILCLSVATPSILMRIKILRRFVKKDVMLFAKLITLTSGGLLIMLAPGIKKSVRKVFYITEFVLWISVFSTILKGLDVEESIITLTLAIVIYILKDGFTDSAIKFEFKDFYHTIMKIAIVSVLFVFISNTAAKVNFFTSTKKYSLHYLLENKKIIVFYILIILLISYISQYTRTKKIEFKKLTDEDFETISEFFDKYGGNEFSHLVFLNDKNVYFNKTKTVMIMYRPVNNSVIVLGDPIGVKENFVEAIDEFINYCSEYHMNVCFYEINGENLELYCDQGFRFVKVGQDATLDLTEFSLVGKKNRTWRHVLNNFDKGDFQFKVEEPTENLLSNMKRVSDNWLAGKNEMGFSLGFFDEKYLKRTKIACIYKENELLAFANLQPFYDKKTISIDLMRYIRSKDEGLMDFIFIKLILWAQENNYEKFYLGMAPLSKVGDKIYSKKKEKMLNIIYNSQNNIYNFKGLRSYKDKFKPTWSNKYIAYTSDFNLPYILISVVNSRKK